MTQWMLYGAYGYSGRLILNEAIKRGLKPVLSGRRKAPLAELAADFGLEYRAFSLDEPRAVANALSGCHLVLNAAGPFAQTAKPMLDACLSSGVHYTDITGELSVLESILSDSERIAAHNVIAIPGVGFDIIPSDCLASLLGRKLPVATSLKLGFKIIRGKVSRGTLITMLEHISQGNWIRRNGVLQPEPFGKRTLEIRFTTSPEPAVAIPWGDVASSFYSTGIKNVEVYLAAPWTQQLIQKLMAHTLSFSFLRKCAQKAVSTFVSGSNESRRKKSRIILWGEVTDEKGNTHEQRLITPDGYDVTALGSVSIVEAILKNEVTNKGAFTPSQLFDCQWLLKQIGASNLDGTEVS